MADFHEPVLLKEAVEYLNVRSGRKYIDVTVGGGGHAAAIIRRGGIVLGIDADSQAVRFAKERLAAEFSVSNSQFSIVQGNFKDIKRIAKENGFCPVAGVLYDLGLSSYQLEHSGRGFSFQRDEPLDMRSEDTLRVSACDLINKLSEKELARLFEKYGEEPRSKEIAQALVRKRSSQRISTSKQLTDIILEIVGAGSRKKPAHPATRVFQALRIVVNNELKNLQSSLPQAFELLESASPRSFGASEGSGGRLVVISFHSLEDRIVKRFFAARGRLLTPKPVIPSAEELLENPRARRAKLRALEKL